MIERDVREFMFKIDDDFPMNPSMDGFFMMEPVLILNVSVAEFAGIPGILYASQVAADEGLPDLATLQIRLTYGDGETKVIMVDKTMAMELGIALLSWVGNAADVEA